MQRAAANIGTVAMALVIATATLFLAACSSTQAFKSSGSEQLDNVLSAALDLRGTPYCSTGNTPRCFDCSGFVQYCLLAAGITAPRTSAELYTIGVSVPPTAIESADLLFFNTSGRGVSHVGLYLGNGTFVHSATSSGVIITKLADPYWSARYIGARRVH